MASAVQEKARPARPPAIVRPPPVRAEIVNESAVRTNMLIIRLDRLINECPCDPSKRKEFEREVVPWSADSESLHCTRCAAKFSIARRRHHCRLCGRMLNMTRSHCEASPSHSRRLLEMTQKTTGKVISFIEGAVSKIQTTDGSEVSLGSLLQQDAQECLRVCGSCMADLSRREQMMEQRNPPALAEQYETLDRMIAEASAMVPSYTRMSDSIKYVPKRLLIFVYTRENMYRISSFAEQLRSRLLQKQRDIDSLSQSIVAEAENENCGVKEAQLRKNIRFACVQTLQSIMSSLVSLPTAQQYEKLVEIHKKEVGRQIEESRMRAANEVVGVRPLTRYLAQAATAGRLEEVEMLERNLRDLEDEMLKMGLISPT
ncbi:FYVE zinc finger [Ostertagia ostertagi]